MKPAVLALGANIGNPEDALRGAIVALSDHRDIALRNVSRVYETEPVGGPEQPRFLNAVAVIETALEPHELLRVTQAIEEQWHRTREVHWGPRTLDIDIIAMGNLKMDSSDLVIPHPRAHERAFVLIPWLEIEPDATLPDLGAMRDYLRELDDAGVEHTDVVLR